MKWKELKPILQLLGFIGIILMVTPFTISPKVGSFDFQDKLTFTQFFLMLLGGSILWIVGSVWIGNREQKEKKE